MIERDFAVEQPADQQAFSDNCRGIVGKIVPDNDVFVSCGHLSDVKEDYLNDMNYQQGQHECR